MSIVFGNFISIQPNFDILTRFCPIQRVIFRKKGGEPVRGLSGRPYKFAEAAFVLAAALVTMLICTKSSPLYPINDWVDANTYLTIGRGLIKGRVAADIGTDHGLLPAYLIKTGVKKLP